LFGKKKVPQVPMPEGHVLDEKALRFPKANSEKSIEPMKIKQAVGFEKKVLPSAPKTEVPKFMPTEMPELSRPMPQPVNLVPIREDDCLHVGIQLYQKILGEMDGLKEDLGGLANANRQLVSSEFNENTQFNRLKKSIKSLHDNLLQIDNILFSSQQGD